MAEWLGCWAVKCEVQSSIPALHTISQTNQQQFKVELSRTTPHKCSERLVRSLFWLRLSAPGTNQQFSSLNPRVPLVKSTKSVTILLKLPWLSYQTTAHMHNTHAVQSIFLSNGLNMCLWNSCISLATKNDTHLTCLSDVKPHHRLYKYVGKN